MNRRLFSNIREKKQLTYDANFRCGVVAPALCSLLCVCVALRGPCRVTAGHKRHQPDSRTQFFLTAHERSKSTFLRFFSRRWHPYDLYEGGWYSVQIAASPDNAQQVGGWVCVCGGVGVGVIRVGVWVCFGTWMCRCDMCDSCGCGGGVVGCVGVICVGGWVWVF